MNDFQRTERTRALARIFDHLRVAHGHLRVAENENTIFALGLGALAELDRKLLHAINRCAHVYQQPPEATL